MMTELGDWLFENNNIFLLSHAVITWGLILYRYNKRQNKAAIQNREESQAESMSIPAEDRHDDSLITVSTSTDLTFLSDDTEVTKSIKCNQLTGRLSTELLAVCHTKIIAHEGSSSSGSESESSKPEPEESSFSKAKADESSSSLQCFSSSTSSLSSDDSSVEVSSSSKTGDGRSSVNVISHLHKTDNASYSSESNKIPEDDEDSEMQYNEYTRQTVFAEPIDLEENKNWKPPVYPKSKDELEHLSGSIKNILIFKELDTDQLESVLNAMYLKRIPKGTIVIKEGDAGDYFYVIHSGKFEVYVMNKKKKRDEKVITYNGSGSFGELALMYDMPRSATVKAVTDGKVWALDRITFKTIVLKGAQMRAGLYDQFLSSVPILQSLKPMERIAVSEAIVEKTFIPGDQIIRQGDKADGMYFIIGGTVSVTVIDTGKEIKLKSLGSGDYFGELALITREPRAANVYAEGNVKLAFLDRGAFERLLGPLKVIMNKRIGVYEEERIRASSTNINRNKTK